MTHIEGDVGHVRVEVTAGGREEAQTLAEEAVDAGLVACAQVSGPITSVYRWEGRVHTDEEWRIVFKTADDRLAELTAHLVDRHSYEVPEIVAVPVEGGNPEYLDWVTESTRPRP
ncbi:divalent-cation tolerance protein CutA [Thermobifida halotolerans]|uniref:Divalent-cation tolerance protein CutA n=1 Tax=Thermobifida halotolerans TaxID=483545 RepID=A0AA97LVH4_9ACTN|nr:divalent-cation tolerance protein CutA [Thermobifida halotolerans]UOE18793.1 divalent-cation tolerance protein CutA [Thermobifida halotolerans]